MTSFNLFELPAELVSQILVDYICQEDVGNLWRNRLVCKIFRDAITEEVHVYQPLEKFVIQFTTRPGEKPILAEEFTSMMEKRGVYRSKEHLQSYFVHRLANLLLCVKPTTKLGQQYSIYVKQIATHVQQKLADTRAVAFVSYDKLCKEDDDPISEFLSAAVIVGDLPAIKYAVETVDTDMCKCSLDGIHILENPIATAVVTANTEALIYLLDKSEELQFESDDDLLEIMEFAIGKAIDMRESDLLRVLGQHVSSRLPPQSSWSLPISSFYTQAILKRRTQMLPILLQHFDLGPQKYKRLLDIFLAVKRPRYVVRGAIPELVRHFPMLYAWFFDHLVANAGETCIVEAVAILFTHDFDQDMQAIIARAAGVGNVYLVKFLLEQVPTVRPESIMYAFLYNGYLSQHSASYMGGKICVYLMYQHVLRTTPALLGQAMSASVQESIREVDNNSYLSNIVAYLDRPWDQLPGIAQFTDREWREAFWS